MEYINEGIKEMASILLEEAVFEAQQQINQMEDVWKDELCAEIYLMNGHNYD